MAAAIKETNYHYDPSASISAQQCAEYIPALLYMYDFILWLMDSVAHADEIWMAKTEADK